jgi:hypothetical protein
MLRLVDITEREADHVSFDTEELAAADLVVYVVYDTSTGTSVNVMDDYIAWRAITTSSDSESAHFEINNDNLYPSYRTEVVDYAGLNPQYFKVMTLQEYDILQDVLIRFDLVRRRMPNPGVTVESTDGVGENGVVAFSGGFWKKKTVDEIMRMIIGSMLELNGSPPRTSFWPVFSTLEADRVNNPYYTFDTAGIPGDMVELIKLGALIRCLISVGIMEVDISFTSSDSGLQLTFDRQSPIKGWHDALLAKYDKDKSLFKWNHANHAGVAVGTVPWAAYGIWGTLMNNVSQGGQLAMSSILGFSARGNVPM